jgi:branched-chain amino acid aminotransferase
MTVWLNGALAEQGAPLAPGLAQGDGLVELMSLRDGNPRRLPAHYLRLRVSCQLLGLPLPITESELQAAVVATARANDRTQGAARVMLTRGRTEIAVEAAPEQHPMKLIVATAARRNEQSPLSMISSLGAPGDALARREAEAEGADDAVLLNGQGRVAETTRANIFVLEGGGLLTPPLEEGAMAGIMRAEVIRLTRAEEMPLPLERLLRASEVFATSALGIRPVIALNGAPVGDGEPGLITQMLAVRL